MATTFPFALAAFADVPSVPDFEVFTEGFSSTTWTITPTSEAARVWFVENYGDAAESINIRKSQLPTFAEHIEAFGLSI